MVAVRVVKTEGGRGFHAVPFLEVSGGNCAYLSPLCDELSFFSGELVHFPVGDCAIKEAFAFRQLTATGTFDCACVIKFGERGPELCSTPAMKKFA